MYETASCYRSHSQILDSSKTQSVTKSLKRGSNALVVRYTLYFNKYKIQHIKKLCEIEKTKYLVLSS